METDKLMAWVQGMEKQEHEWWARFERELEMERERLTALIDEPMQTDTSARYQF